MHASPAQGPSSLRRERPQVYVGWKTAAVGVGPPSWSTCQRPRRRHSLLAGQLDRAFEGPLPHSPRSCPVHHPSPTPHAEPTQRPEELEPFPSRLSRPGSSSWQGTWWGCFLHALCASAPPSAGGSRGCSHRLRVQRWDLSGEPAVWAASPWVPGTRHPCCPLGLLCFRGRGAAGFPRQPRGRAGARWAEGGVRSVVGLLGQVSRFSLKWECICQWTPGPGLGPRQPSFRVQGVVGAS